MKRIIPCLAKPPLCACGCGQPVKWSKIRPYQWNVYLRNHHQVGKHHSKIWNEKIRDSNKGRIKSEEEIKNLIKARKIRDQHYPPPGLGSRRTVEQRKQMSLTMLALEYHHDEKTRQLIADAGRRPCPRERAKKIGDAQRGEKSHNWRGGTSIIKYAEGFTLYLKEQIFKRDKRICQICHDDAPKRFAVHHINYDKSDHRPKNLILLCHHCHSRTNWNREKWIKSLRG